MAAKKQKPEPKKTRKEKQEKPEEQPEQTKSSGRQPEEPGPEPQKAQNPEQLAPIAQSLSVVSLEEEMKKSYLDYALSVIIGRAIPDIKDGLKPVHRRVLYAMWETSTTHNKPYKKSARIVGDVIGKYHPHGDVAVYDALVRMAQDFSMRYPLVDGQGNFGSIDGDPPAAMRYTEVRMTRLAEELLADIEKDTVNFVPNYDESLLMPEVLPAKFPNLLVNGASGIAVGMATNIPPHNLAEVCDGLVYLIDHPRASLDDIMKYIPGPDFPTGGYVFNRQNIRQAYQEGKGVIHLRAKTTIERADKGERDRIVITEIPYGVNKARLLENIADLVNNKKIEGIADIRDESDREGIRVVIEVKRGELPEIILNNLYKHTALQTSFGIIMLAIVDKQPKLLNLLEMMNYFIAHRRDVIIRRTKHDLKKAEHRAHILEGLLIALDYLDAVINLIRSSKTVEEAKNGLMTRFKLTAIQAQAILEMQLQRLTGLERQKIVQEHRDLLALIKQLKLILKNPEMVLQIIKDELKQLKEQYKDERRTEIRDEVITEIKAEDLIKEEDVAIVYTQSGYIKRTSLSAYRYQSRGGKGRKGIEMKAEDVVENLFVGSTHSYLLVFTNRGRMYWLKALDVPDVGPSGRGKAIVNLLEMQPDEKVQSILAVKEFREDQYVVIMTDTGLIKKTRLSEFKNVRRGGIIAMSLKPKSQLFTAALTDGKNDIIIGTRMGKAIRFKEKLVRPMGRQAAGVKAITLKPKDRVISMIVVGPEDKYIFTASERGYGKKTPVEDYPAHNRGGQGVINLKITDKIGPALAMVGVNEDDLLIITISGKVIRIKTTEIRPLSRATQGVRLIQLEDKDRVCSIAKVRED
ncbi:MAG: DNA gyrase subunit A [Candidatus Saccharicenans subterraneus]|uniref:DNA gyrase subunit A n=1 Tax=Candidatus Saccharicenans subterraneus TaxID=2508984 RepID=A0A3E2BL22_9BACT|nr:MAG: DNA gyrase subunit A [Candidatus Saccharicenans subterraneum]